MEIFAEVLTAFGLFVLGIGLSFFFSGTETAFYRVSTVRLTIEANAGDRIAQRLLRLTLRPGQFVATTLVGNNVANYLVSLGTGVATAVLVHSGGFAEVVGTWAVTPVVFVFGELLPKNICYLTPSWLLRRGAGLFRLFYWLFLPLAMPLALVSHLLERLAGTATGSTDFVFGRSRLTQVFSQGRQAGLLTDAQGRFLTGLLSTSSRAVADSMTPTDRVYGIGVNADREQVLDHARRFALTDVVLGNPDEVGTWSHYVQVADLSLSGRPVSAHLKPLPRFDARQAKLEVLLSLRTAGDTLGAVIRDGRVIGIVNERGLVESFFRAGRPLGVAPATI